jgi:hypothetical protein
MMRLPRVRFTVRLLMATVLALGSWLGWVARGARIQRSAARAVQQSMARTSYGALLYDWQYQGGKVKGSGKPRWPAWLMDRLGVEYFHRITWVSLCNPTGPKPNNRATSRKVSQRLVGIALTRRHNRFSILPGHHR